MAVCKWAEYCSTDHFPAAQEGNPPPPREDPPAALPGPDPKAPKHPTTLSAVPSLSDLGYPGIEPGKESPFKVQSLITFSRMSRVSLSSHWALMAPH